MKIVVLDGYTENPGDLSWDALGALGDLRVYDRTPRDKVAERLQGAEAVFTNKVPLGRELIEGCPSLRFICVLATGYNIIDGEAARRRGIPVSNIPSYSTEAVAQHTFALLLEIVNQVGRHSAAVHAGEWQNCPDFTFQKTPLMELSGKVMGFIGFGQIGMRAAKIAAAFGMECLAYSRSRRPAGEALARYVPLEELLEKADVVSLHCPLTPETQGMIDAKALARMKKGAILLNTARGPLVVEADVAAALESGQLYAMGADVVSGEPIRPDNPLLGAKNCFLTPHLAWAAQETRQRLMDIAVGNLRAFQAGHSVNVVNP